MFYAVPLTAAALEGTSDADSASEDMADLGLTAILDSGSTFTFLPDFVADAIAEEFGAVEISALLQGLRFIDCAAAGEYGEGKSVSFTFGGSATIEVPLEELVTSLDGATEEGLELDQLFDLPFDPCFFGVQPSSWLGIREDRFALIGDTVLRSAYVVYDVANHQVGLAQANLNSTKSEIVELEAGGTEIGDVKGVEGKS